MIAVAVIAAVLALGIEGFRLKRFRDECLTKAAAYAELEQFSRNMGGHFQKLAADADRAAAESSSQSSAEAFRREAAQDRVVAASYSERAVRLSARKQKFRRAAKRPWRSVEPDGPERMKAE
jgi:hypothetical protein